MPVDFVDHFKANYFSLLLEADHDHSIDQTSHDESALVMILQRLINGVIIWQLTVESVTMFFNARIVSYRFLGDDLWIFKKYRFDVNLVYTKIIHTQIVYKHWVLSYGCSEHEIWSENEAMIARLWTPMLVYTDAG